MKQYKLILLVLIGFTNSTSCKKTFLDVPDKRAIVRKEYVVDLRTTSEFLNGVYINLSSYFYSGLNTIYPDLIADNIKLTDRPLASHYAWVQRASKKQSVSLQSIDNMNPIWLCGYKVIRDCNFIIENVDRFKSENTAKANDIKGQAYALRALTHAGLANIFAQSYNFTTDASHLGIPYIEISDWSQPISRQTVAEIYSKMIVDLNSAIELLPATSDNKLFINRNAAKALLSRIYLFKGDYQIAKNIAREIIDNAPMMSGQDYPSKLFTFDESESLFQIAPFSGAYYTDFSGGYFSQNYWQLFVPTNDIVDILTEDINDKRSAWVTDASGHWEISKYPVGVASIHVYPEMDYYQTILRSSEMYLTAAEAYARLNNEDSARAFLNDIRTRANTMPVAATVTGAALLDSIYKERRKEFAFEGFRMFDLLRWKKGVNRLDAPEPLAQNLPYPSNKAIAPIPIQDVELLGLPQNIGY